MSAACLSVRGACVYSFPFLPLISAFSCYFSFPQFPPPVFLSPEIRSLNLPLINSVPEKGKKSQDGEGEGIYRITVSDSIRYPATQASTNRSRCGVMGHMHEHTHHVTIPLHDTTTPRGQVMEERVRGRKQTTKGGATNGIFFLYHHAGQGKARHAGARKYPPVLLPQLLCSHRSVYYKWLVFTFG